MNPFCAPTSSPEMGPLCMPISRIAERERTEVVFFGQFAWSYGFERPLGCTGAMLHNSGCVVAASMAWMASSTAVTLL